MTSAVRIDHSQHKVINRKSMLNMSNDDPDIQLYEIDDDGNLLIGHTAASINASVSIP